MRIGIDITHLNKESLGRGIGFYTENLIKSLKKFTSDEIVVIDNKIIPSIDLMHYPYFDFFTPSLPFFKKYPTVITIHDVTPLKFPQNYPPGIKGSFNNLLQRISLKSVSSIITDSDTSKKDINEILNISASKIKRVYLAPKDSFKKISDKSKIAKFSEKYNLADNFAVFAGSVNWNKNLINLTKAAVDARIDLYLTGKGFEQRENLSHPELKSYKLFLDEFSNNPKVHILGFLPSGELTLLFSAASILLFPSLYEGFGLPILEAQACGLPVITSNISSMPEVAGEGAIYVNPTDYVDIKNKINLLMKDRNLREILIKKGFENVKRFNWEKVARETSFVYHHL